MNNFFSEINDQLNPILVKETRQTLTRIGYYVVGALVLLLIRALLAKKFPEQLHSTSLQQGISLLSFS